MLCPLFYMRIFQKSRFTITSETSGFSAIRP